MNEPTGYTALDLVGFTDKGVYNSATNYVQNDIVHYGGDMWRCLIDDTTNIAPSEGLNWTLWIGEPTNLTEAIIAPLEVSPATAAHSAGDQLIFNDVLYKVISAISIGDSLTVGTNIEAARKIVYQISGIESDIATIEPTSTASQNYAVGEYMFFGWEFYKVTTAITAGDTIVTSGSGQNVTEVTIGEELAAVNSHLANKAPKSDLASLSETGATASTIIPSGTYFYLDGVLKKSLVEIASGAAFTVSNCATVTDGALNDLKGDDRVSVTANGVKTYQTLLNELFALIDYHKVSQTTVFKNNLTYYSAFRLRNTEYIFSTTRVGSSDVSSANAVLSASSSAIRSAKTTTSGTTFTDETSDKPDNGTVLSIIY